MLLLGGAMAAPRLLRAQQKALPVIGYLDPSTLGPITTVNVTAFHQGLAETGYIEGQNVTLEYRWAEGNYDRLPALAADLVKRKVDVIATFGSGDAIRALKSLTSTIPVVFLWGNDPVAAGIVASLARPGGNLTGVVNMTTELFQKRLELLSELVPQADLIALLLNRSGNQAIRDQIIRSVQEAARVKQVHLHVLTAGNAGEIDAAFEILVQQRAGALIVFSDAFFSSRREQFIALAAHHAVPTMYPWHDSAAAGGLISFGTSNPTMFRQVGIYAGRILKGEKPADLPIHQPTKFHLAINLKTAESLGLTVPQSLLARADEVIE
jgi:putative ABC transport system substrate-binding protein